MSDTTTTALPTPSRRITVVQVLPALESGGVERGTLELADELVRLGHRSIVVSAGGRLVQHLLDHGSEHVAWDIGRKSPTTLRCVFRLRKLLRDEKIDILHARSRLPAWVAYLAWRTTCSYPLPHGARPGRGRPEVAASREQTAPPHFVTTMHGQHSVSAYSAIMTRGQRVIAVSNTIRRHILEAYPRTDESRVRLIERGVDPIAFPHGYRPSDEWMRRWRQQYPQLVGKRVLVLPGRITRLKGHADFIGLLRRLLSSGVDCVGLIVGDEDPRRTAYAKSVREMAGALGDGRVVFTGHRADVREVYSASDVVLSLSSQPESFGRTVLEALALGVPVVGYDHGGVGEILATLLPGGAVPMGDADALAARVSQFLSHRPSVPINERFTLRAMLDRTLAVYAELVDGTERVVR